MSTFVGVFIIAIAAALFVAGVTGFGEKPAYPQYKTVQVEVQTSQGLALCTFEEFTSGQAIFFGCDVGTPGGGA